MVGTPHHYAVDYYAVDAAAQRRHMEALLAATGLPVLLYNIPQATGQALAPATVRGAGGRAASVRDQGLSR